MQQTKERLFHHVTITVFCKPHDSEASVLAGLDQVSPVPSETLLAQEKEYDPERPNTIHYHMQDIELTVSQTPTDEGKMIIYTLFFKRMSWVNAFGRKLVSAMTKEEKEQFSDDPSSALDADGKLSMRLDKEILMRGRFVLTNDGNCYQVKASVAAYPKNEERILAAVRKMLEQEHA